MIPRRIGVASAERSAATAVSVVSGMDGLSFKTQLVQSSLYSERKESFQKMRSCYRSADGLLQGGDGILKRASRSCRHFDRFQRPQKRGKVVEGEHRGGVREGVGGVGVDFEKIMGLLRALE